jgi:hypothetical protein
LHQRQLLPSSKESLQGNIEAQSEMAGFFNYFKQIFFLKSAFSRETISAWAKNMINFIALLFKPWISSWP